MKFLINQYSFVALSILLVLAAGLILLGSKPKLKDYLAFCVIVLGFVAGWGILHPRQTLLMDEAQKVKAMIGAGTPVLLEFQSPY